MVCDITKSLEANPVPILSKHKCDGESLQSTNTENGLKCEGGDIMGPI